jgi:hypothetical protein
MPFSLYDVDAASSTYSKMHKIGLAGANSPFPHILAAQNPGQQHPFCWQATASDVIKALRLPPRTATPSNPSIVMDLMPSRTSVCLYELREVCGFSEAWHTVLALFLDSLVVDQQTDNPDMFKSRFSVDPPAHRPTGQFLYLQGGVHGGGRGTWQWGRAGYINAAILYPGAFKCAGGWLAGKLGLKCP